MEQKQASKLLVPFSSMALTCYGISYLNQIPSCPLLQPVPKLKACNFIPILDYSSISRTALVNVVSDGSESGNFTSGEDPSPAFSGSLSSSYTQLDLLDQLSSNSSDESDYDSDGSWGKGTIREQLAPLAGDRDDDFSIPLGKDLKKFTPKFLTVSQKRNIKRQAYLNEVSQRNDSSFFATIGAFVLLPPLVILGIAILTGYVQLFP